MKSVVQITRAVALASLLAWVGDWVVRAAELKLSLVAGGVDYPIVAISAGDTMTWTYLSGGPAFIEEYSGAWKSPLLTNEGDHFSVTFANAGFYVYRTAAYTNTVSVLPVASPSPAITLNFPLQGFRFGNGQGGSIPLLATPTGAAADILRVEFLAGTNLLGVVAEPPYHLSWTNLASFSGRVDLIAQVVDRRGATHSSQPVGVAFGSEANLLFPRVLPGGGFLCYYTVFPEYSQFAYADIYLTDRIYPPNFRWVRSIYGPSYGVFVDPGAPNGGGRLYFTTLNSIGGPPPLPPRINLQ